MQQKIVRALLSVTDKSGLAEFAKGLSEMGVSVISTGGTAKALRDAGLDVTDVAEVTGFPEMLDGRVKTLHPRVHGAILARRDDPNHRAQLAEHHIAPIDLVCVNLYAFEATIAKAGCTLDDAVENIDIGGPCLIRASAKNHKDVTVITDPADYAPILEEMRQNDGSTTLKTRRAWPPRPSASPINTTAPSLIIWKSNKFFPGENFFSLKKVFPRTPFQKNLWGPEKRPGCRLFARRQAFKAMDGSCVLKKNFGEHIVFCI